VTDTGTIDTINTHLHRLGWQAYIPAFAELLQRFEGTQDEREWGNDNTLPECLCAWLASLTGEEPQPSRLALFAVRHWQWLHFHAEASGIRWDYRRCSFTAFCQQSGGQSITTRFVQTQCHHPELSRSLGWLRRTPFPTLAQGLGFLRQHRLAAGKQG
jgi:hypothetical protein